MMTNTPNNMPGRGGDWTAMLAAQLAAAGAYADGDQPLFSAIAAWRRAVRAFESADERDRGTHRAAEREFYRTDGIAIETPACSLAGILAKLTVTIEDSTLWEMAAEHSDDRAQRIVSVWLDFTKLAFDSGLPIWAPSIDGFAARPICARMMRRRAILPNGASPSDWCEDATDTQWRVGETFHVAAFTWEIAPTFMQAVSPTPPAGREILGRLIGSKNFARSVRN